MAFILMAPRYRNVRELESRKKMLCAVQGSVLGSHRIISVVAERPDKLFREWNGQFLAPLVPTIFVRWVSLGSNQDFPSLSMTSNHMAQSTLTQARLRQASKWKSLASRTSPFPQGGFLPVPTFRPRKIINSPPFRGRSTAAGLREKCSDREIQT
nr:hypothetical protein CFP56_36451 [Quercus suber]